MIIRRLGAFFLDILEVVIFAVAIFLFIYLLILQPHKIKGASMEPNYPDGEYLITDKVSYRFNEPKRGDVVVFKAPGQQGEEFIKRIIGLPGERVSIKDGFININGTRLIEPYLENSFTTTGAFLKTTEEITIPSGQYFVLGDNRPFSSDSRAWGLVPIEDITGRAWLTYWPPQNAGFVEKVVY